MKKFNISIFFLPEIDIEPNEMIDYIKSFEDRLRGLGYIVKLEEPPDVSIDSNTNHIVYTRFNISIYKVGEPLKIDPVKEITSDVIELPKNELWTYLYLTFMGNRWEKMKIETSVQDIPEEDVKPPVKPPQDDKEKGFTFDWGIIGLIGLAILAWLFFFRR